VALRQSGSLVTVREGGAHGSERFRSAGSNAGGIRCRDTSLRDGCTLRGDVGSGLAVHTATVAVLLVVVGLAVGLSVSARAVHNGNDERLLRQRLREATLVITNAPPAIQAPLASAAEVAEVTNGDETRFARVMVPLVGQGRPFVSGALWSVIDSSSPRVGL
jgi:hypothetical protein